MSNWYHEALIDVTDPETVTVSYGVTESGEERICLSLPGKRPQGDGWDINREENKDLNVLALTPEVARIVWEALDSRFAPERAREWAAQMRKLQESGTVGKG